MGLRDLLRDGKFFIKHHLLQSRPRGNGKSAIQSDSSPPLHAEHTGTRQVVPLPGMLDTFSEDVKNPAKESAACSTRQDCISIQTFDSSINQRISESAVDLSLKGKANLSGSYPANPQPSKLPEIPSSLWNEAYNQVSADKDAIDFIKAYEEIIIQEVETTAKSALATQSASERPSHAQMSKLIKKKTKEIEEDAWKLGFRGREVVVRDVIKSVASILEWGKDFVGGALQPSPPAALAWSGVCLLLPLLLKPEMQAETRVKGLDMIASIIRECFLRETLYQRHCRALKTAETVRYKSAQAEYEGSIKDLYSQIILFQVSYVCFLSGHSTAKRWLMDVTNQDEWHSKVDSVKEKNLWLRSLDQQWKGLAKWDIMVKQHAEDVKGLAAVQKEIERFRVLVGKAESDEKRRRLLETLQTVAPAIHYNAALEKRRPYNTGGWVLESKSFADWLKVSGSFLWIAGRAGAGKSVLSSNIIEYLHSLFESDPYTTVAYFYVTASDKATCNVNNLTKSLVAQLFRRRSDTPGSLLRLETYRDTYGATTQPKLEEALRSGAEYAGGTYIVIDGLDECPASDNDVTKQSERRMLLRLLGTIQKWNLPNFHLLVTSRYEKDIADQLLALNFQVVDLTSEAHGYSSQVNNDMSTVIDAELGQTKFDALSEDEKRNIKTTLIENADGVFHYVALQLDSFDIFVKPKNVEETLKSLPVTLNKTYETALSRLTNQQKKHSRLALTWLAFAPEPLTIAELSAAVSICLLGSRDLNEEVAEKDFLVPFFDEEDLPKDPKQVLKVLPGLHKFKSKERTDEDTTTQDHTDALKPDQTVVLTHLTLFEYLTSKEVKNGRAKDFALDHTEANLQLAEVCLRYHILVSQSSATIDSHELCLKYPLWKYVSCYGLRHVENVSRKFWPRSLRRLVRFVLQDGTEYFAKLKLHSSYASQRTYDLPIQYAIDNQLSETVEFLFEEGLADVHMGSDYKELLLMQAVEKKNIDIANSLLRRYGADPNAKSLGGNPATLQAYQNTNIDIVQLLLECGADVNASNGRGETLLFEAAYRNDVDMVKHLVEREARVFATLAGENAFHWAAYHNDIRLADALMGTEVSGIGINAQTDMSHTPLHWATANEHTEMVRWLLEKGAKVDARTSENETALHLAFAGRSKSLEILGLLLDNGADVNAFNKAGETAIFLSMRKRNRGY